MHELVEELLSHLRAAWRYRWFGVVAAWIIAVAGWSFVYVMPERYEAYTRVFVDTKSVLRPLLRGLAVQPDVEEMVEIMSQTLISRPNIEKVIEMAGPDIGLETDDDREILMTRLQNELSIRRTGKENLYVISFTHEDPWVAKRVVEALLELFVERSLGDKRQDADSARRFIDGQLEGYRETLKTSESAIMSFKRRHLGLLPGEGPGYFQRLVETQRALREAELELREAENAAESIRKQLALAARNVSSPSEQPVANLAEPETVLDVRIRELETKLDDLRLTYTEQHPDVEAIVPMIAKLKERKRRETQRIRRQIEADAKQNGGVPSTALVQDPVYQELTVALTTAESNIAVLQTRVIEYRKRNVELQAAANAIPEVEAEYTQLTRDYQVNKARYDELLKRRESAEISGDLEETDAAMGFRVIDPPRLPRLPSGPSREILVSIVLLAALAGGIAIAWLISQMKPTINDERDLKVASDLPVLGTVVMAWTDVLKKRRNRGITVFFASLASLVSTYAAIMAALVLAVSGV